MKIIKKQKTNLRDKNNYKPWAIATLGIAAGLFGTIFIYTNKNNYKPNQNQERNQKLDQKDIKMEYIKLPSGLEYKVLEAGDGKTTPKPGQMATIDYTGYLKDTKAEDGLGKKFDSSVGKKPLSFVLGSGQVIKGFDEGVLSMRQGEKRRIIIPANIGYGVHGVPGVIPGNSTLIFDIKLIDVK